MLHPEITKYLLYSFAMFFEKAKSAKIKIRENVVSNYMYFKCLDYGSLLELLGQVMQELFWV